MLQIQLQIIFVLKLYQAIVRRPSEHSSKKAQKLWQESFPQRLH